jgi:hypothetical protein
MPAVRNQNAPDRKDLATDDVPDGLAIKPDIHLAVGRYHDFRLSPGANDRGAKCAAGLEETKNR